MSDDPIIDQEALQRKRDEMVETAKKVIAESEFVREELRKAELAELDIGDRKERLEATMAKARKIISTYG